MIMFNRGGPFGSKTAVVTDVDSVTITVNSARDGLFKGLSTIILFGYLNQGFPVLKVEYANFLKKEARLDVHDEIVELLDKILQDTEGQESPTPAKSTKDHCQVVDELIDCLRGRAVIRTLSVPAPDSSMWVPIT